LLLAREIGGGKPSPCAKLAKSEPTFTSQIPSAICPARAIELLLAMCPLDPVFTRDEGFAKTSAGCPVTFPLSIKLHRAMPCDRIAPALAPSARQPHLRSFHACPIDGIRLYLIFRGARTQRFRGGH
jgi:hypothetical protein